MAFYLAFKEITRNKGRFFLFSLVIALITTLVLFIAALADGLALANREFFDKLDADLLVFQKNAELSAASSRIDFSLLNNLERIASVDQVGPIGLSSASLVLPDGSGLLDISLIGVEAAKPGDPPLIAGADLRVNRGYDLIIDSNVASKTGLNVGDQAIIRSIQGSEEKYFKLDVIGITDGRQYLYQPSVFLPYQTWEKIRPQAANRSMLVETTSNIVAITLKPGSDPGAVSAEIASQVKDIDVSDKKTAIESLPGYSVQQSTLKTQQGFTLLIGILVIGGFFQIQMLQKIPLIGVMKAIGTSNNSVGLSVVLQIILITSFGVLLGTLVTLGLSLGIPDTVPIVFDGSNIVLAIATLLAIGPVGGLVSVRRAVTVEPLIALGLTA